MALPRATDTYDDYTDQLVYLAARLAANPTTASLAQDTELLLSEMDQYFLALRNARREEMRKRALRDHHDDASDTWAQKFQRRLFAIVDSGHFVRDRIFPKGIRQVTAPRGQEQVERLRKLEQRVDEVLESPQLAADADAAELTSLLQAFKISSQQNLNSLQPPIDAWNSQVQLVTKAQNAFNFIRQQGVSRVGVTIGQLRAVLGGSVQAAHAYTQARRVESSTPDEPATDEPVDSEPPKPSED